MSNSENLCLKCGCPGNYCCQRCFECYCSSECQILDWKQHKISCLQMPELLNLRKVYEFATGAGDGSGTGRRNSNAMSDHRAQTPMRRPNSRGSNDVHITRHAQQREVENNNNHINHVNSAIPSISTPKSKYKFPDEKDFKLKPAAEPKPLPWKAHYMPPTDSFFDAIIQFVEELDPSIIWITETKYDKCLLNMLREINRNIDQNKHCRPIDVFVGSLVAAPLNELYYRTEVLEVNTAKELATVRLVDYGNELLLPFTKLHPSGEIPIMSNMPAYAFRVRVPQNSGPLEVETIINVRIVGDKVGGEAGYYRVDVKPKTVPLYLPVELLSRNPELHIVKMIGNQHVLMRLHQLQTVAEGNDLNTYLNSEQGLKFSFNSIPAEGSFVAARTLKGWQRACLLGYIEKHCEYLVYLMDEGHIGMCREIKKIPQTFIAEPMRVLAISMSAEVQQVFRTLQLAGNNKLSLRLLPSKVPVSKQPKTLACTLYRNEEKLCDVVASIFTGFLDDLSDLKYWTEGITNGSSVFITHVISFAEVYIASSRTKLYAEIFASLASKCAPYAADETIAAGDIVLVEKELGKQLFYRAEVLRCLQTDNPLKQVFELVNIDTGVPSNVSIQHLRKASRFIRSCSVYLQKVKLLYIEDIKTCITDNKALAALKEHQRNATEFNVKSNNIQVMESVDLIFCGQEQISLCKSLLPLIFEKCVESVDAKGEVNDTAEETPLPPSRPSTPVLQDTPVELQKAQIDSTLPMSAAIQPTAAPSKEHLTIPHINNLQLNGSETAHKLYTIDDLDIVPITVGDNVPIFVLDASTIANGYITASDFGNKTFLLELEKHFAKLSSYCKCEHLPKGYKPKRNELCLAVFPEDNEWYRAICIDNQPEADSYLVMFVDYGNTCRVASDQILSITKDLMFPSNANLCHIEGLAAEQCEQFIKFVSKSPIINCKVVQVETDTYMLTLRNLNKLLSS